MKTIKIKKFAGSFAENKDVARQLRIDYILPTLHAGKEIIIDFKDVSGATQSFIHALISEPLRQFGDQTLELVSFKDCSPIVREIVSTVVEYIQEA
jgi:hypothetical protein